MLARLYIRAGRFWSGCNRAAGYQTDGSPGSSGTQLLPPGSPDDFSRIDPVAKNQVLEDGPQDRRHSNELADFALPDPGRAKLHTYEGATLTSQEIANLTLYAGQIRAESVRNLRRYGQSPLLYGGRYLIVSTMREANTPSTRIAR